jgi:hypothetical protein
MVLKMIIKQIGLPLNTQVEEKTFTHIMDLQEVLDLTLQ